jgi:hypothetical protein
MSISTDDNTSAATQPVTIDQIVHINTPLSIKLNDSKFLSWKSQVLLIVEGYDLVSYLLNDPPDPATRNDKGESDKPYLSLLEASRQASPCLGQIFSFRLDLGIGHVLQDLQRTMASS